MEEFEAYIEMVAGSDIKHVFDEKQGKLVVHRRLSAPLPHPFNYGFVKGTHSDDGDPIDVFVISSLPLALGASVRMRPIGVLYVDDEMGIDNKVIAVNSTDSSLNNIADISHIEDKIMDEIKYSLEHNKDGLPRRWTKVKGVGDAKEALSELKRMSLRD
ncbi:inorganic pyrophosphatase [mine drainage metagenome]|uniref:inorganic diphosphatase n=1 Tax=mine drainage metagenome TaxID=410659 RepID=T1BIM7_9ZZZZ